MTMENSPSPHKAEVEEQLQRMLASKRFRIAANQAAFLDLAVTRTLNGKKVTEDIVGRELFGEKFLRDATDDVRVTAHSLRKKLREYYDDEGRDDPILISFPTPPKDNRIKLPRGEAYRPRFHYNPRHPIAQDFALAQFYMQTGHPLRLKLAINILIELLESDPENALLLSTVAEALCLVKITDPHIYGMFTRYSGNEWVERLAEVINLAPPNWWYYAVLGASRMLTGRGMKAASDAFETALTLDKSCTQRYGWYHAFLFAADRSEEAVALIKVTADERPTDAYAQALYALWLLGLREFSKVREVLHTIMLLDVDCWLATYIELNLNLCSIDAKQIADHVLHRKSLITTFSIPANTVFAKDEVPKYPEQSWVSCPLDVFCHALSDLSEGEFNGAIRDLKVSMYVSSTPLILWLHMMPMFDPMRDCSGFQDLLARRVAWFVNPKALRKKIKLSTWLNLTP